MSAYRVLYGAYVVGALLAGSAMALAEASVAAGVVLAVVGAVAATAAGEAFSRRWVLVRR